MRASFLVGGERVEVEVTRRDGLLTVEVPGGARLTVRAEALGGGAWRLSEVTEPGAAVSGAVSEARRVTVAAAEGGGASVWGLGARPVAVQRQQARQARAGRVEAAAPVVSGIGPGCAPMPGVVVRAAEVGAVVAKGEAVAAITAMKMEHPIRAPWAARVVARRAMPGQAVAKGAAVVELERVQE